MDLSLKRAWPEGGLWRHGDFLKLWSAQTVSEVGTQVSQLAIPLTAIIVLHASAFEVALLGTIDFLPFLLFSLPAGVWVDRLPRRPILVIGDLGRAAALVSIPIAYAAGGLTIWQLYVVGFTTGILTVFFDVAYQSYLPVLVEREHMIEGNSKLEVTRSAAQIAGPGLGGVIVGALTAPYAILVDSISFVASGSFVFTIRTHEPPVEPQEHPSMRRELLEGVRYLLADARWRAIAGCTATGNFCSNIIFSIILVYAVREVDLSAQLIGLVLTLGSFGGLAGAALSRKVSRRFGVGHTIVGAAVLFGPAELLIPAAPQSTPIPFFVAAMVLSGAGAVVYNVTGLSLMQTLTPDRL